MTAPTVPLMLSRQKMNIINSRTKESYPPATNVTQKGAFLKVFELFVEAEGPDGCSLLLLAIDSHYLTQAIQKWQASLSLAPPRKRSN